MLVVDYKNENINGFVSDCLKDEEKKGLFILKFPIKRQGSQTGKILTDWQTLDDLELVLTIQKNDIQYIKDLYNNTYVLKKDGSIEAINTSETKDATFVAVDVIQSFSDLEIIRRYKKYFKKLFFVSTRSAMSVYYKKFYKLDVKTQKIKKEITKNTKVNPEFTEDANYLTGVYVMQEEEIEMPSIEFTPKDEEMPSIEFTPKDEEIPSIEFTPKDEEMPSIEFTPKDEEIPSIEFTPKDEEIPSIEFTPKDEEMPSIEFTPKDEEMPSIEVMEAEAEAEEEETENYKILKNFIKKDLLV